jgi:hypothetical protein
MRQNINVTSVNWPGAWPTYRGRCHENNRNNVHATRINPNMDFIINESYAVYVSISTMAKFAVHN